MGKFPAIQVQRSKYADKVVAGETAITGEQIKNALNEMVILVVENITAMTDDDINGLKSGDVVLKKTGDAYHSYRVSYKQDNQGICLTYSDASIVETVSYDLTEGHWIYNSTDKSTIENRQEKLSSSSVNDGTPDKVLAFDAQGNLIKGTVDAGVSLQDNSLVIPEQLEPVIIIDGVSYYHKQEFDLSSLQFSEKYYDLLTGELVSASHGARLYSFMHGRNEVYLNLKANVNSPSFALYPDGGNYSSRAFTVVSSNEEVTDNTKIYIPNCAAYYGYLDEDNLTFISYYNLISDVPSSIKNIKQGTNIIPIVSGVKLYKHILSDGTISIEFYSLDATNYGGSGSSGGIPGPANGTIISFGFYWSNSTTIGGRIISGTSSAPYKAKIAYIQNESELKTISLFEFGTTITDTVTEL